MKVLIIHNSGSSRLPSGELVVAKNELEAIRQSGAECNLHIIYNDEVNVGNPLKKLSAGVNIFWSYPSYKLVKDLIDKYKPDIVHFHGVLPLLTASSFYACKKRGVPVVQTLHNFRWICVEGGLFRDNTYCEICIHSSGWQGVVYGCSKGSRFISLLLFFNNLLYRKPGLLYSWVDKFIAVSEFVKEKHLQAGFPEDKIVVKHNGLNVKRSEDISIDPALKKGVTFVGRLSVAKGTHLLKKIFNEMKDTSFNIVGDGPDLDELIRYCKDAGFHNVTFWGKLDTPKVHDIISKSACIIMPSIFAEAFPMVSIEAMMYESPIVASRIGGLERIIEKSGCGILVNPADIGEFVTAIKSIINSPEKIQIMGVAGKTYADKYLNLEYSISCLLEIYKKVISENNKKKILWKNFQSSLSTLHRFLCICISKKTPVVKTEYYSKIDGGALFDIAKNNEVESIVAHSLIYAFDTEKIPAHWSLAHEDVFNRISGYMKELDRIAGVFVVKGIPLVALKNAGIARGIYPCPGCCPMGDLDVLVDKKHFRKAHEILLNEGYHFEFRSPLEEAEIEAAEQGGGAEYWKILPNGEKLWFELQWRPVAGRWLRPDQEPSAEELIARSISIPGTAVRLLSPEDNLLQVSLHTAKHTYVRAPGFRLHLDVERIVRYQHIDWEIFLGLVLRLQVKTSVYFSLLIPRLLFNTPIPDEVLLTLKPSYWKEFIITRWLNRVGLFNPHEKKFSKIGYIVFTSLLYDDFRGLWRSIFPDKAWMREKHKSTSEFQLMLSYVKRLIDLALRRTNT